jgi:hypothetical protein
MGLDDAACFHRLIEWCYPGEQEGGSQIIQPTRYRDCVKTRPTNSVKKFLARI